jgi:hypothetical protein
MNEQRKQLIKAQLLQAKEAINAALGEILDEEVEAIVPLDQPIRDQPMARAFAPPDQSDGSIWIEGMDNVTWVSETYDPGRDPLPTGWRDREGEQHRHGPLPDLLPRRAC